MLKGEPFKVTPAIPLTALPIGTVKMPVSVVILLPVGRPVLFTAISRVGVAVVSTLAMTCAGKKLGRSATWSTKELAHVLVFVWAVVMPVVAILLGIWLIGAPDASRILSVWLFMPIGLLAKLLGLCPPKLCVKLNNS